MERWIFHSSHLLLWCERDSETKHRKRTAQLTTGRSLQECTAWEWTQCSAVQDPCVIPTHMFIVCAFTQELWDRDVLSKLVSQISIISFALYFKVILEHTNNISFVRDDLENQLHPFTYSIEAHILGILDSQQSAAQLYHFTFIAMQTYFPEQRGKLVGTKNSLYILYSVKLFQHQGG